MLLNPPRASLHSVRATIKRGDFQLVETQLDGDESDSKTLCIINTVFETRVRRGESHENVAKLSVRHAEGGVLVFADT